MPIAEDRAEFERILSTMNAQLANAGTHGAIDGNVRMQYSRMIREMAAELRHKANSGQITWRQAATEANSVRNTVMDALRGRSTPLGRALAEQMKSQGRSLNELVGRKTQQLYGRNSSFSRLSSAQQNRVYAEIVSSAGKSNPRVNAQMRTLSRAGRGLIVLSVAISVYNIATSDDKAAAARREGTVLAAGVGGGIAGGALAGLACGPGAPVCVGIGAFVGGALAAFGVDFVFF